MTSTTCVVDRQRAPCALDPSRPLCGRSDYLDSKPRMGRASIAHGAAKRSPGLLNAEQQKPQRGEIPARLAWSAPGIPARPRRYVAPPGLVIMLCSLQGLAPLAKLCRRSAARLHRICDLRDAFPFVRRGGLPTNTSVACSAITFRHRSQFTGRPPAWGVPSSALRRPSPQLSCASGRATAGWLANAGSPAPPR